MRWHSFGCRACVITVCCVFAILCVPYSLVNVYFVKFVGALHGRVGSWKPMFSCGVVVRDSL